MLMEKITGKPASPIGGGMLKIETVREWIRRRMRPVSACGRKHNLCLKSIKTPRNGRCQDKICPHLREQAFGDGKPEARAGSQGLAAGKAFSQGGQLRLGQAGGTVGNAHIARF